MNDNIDDFRSTLMSVSVLHITNHREYQGISDLPVPENGCQGISHVAWKVRENCHGST